MATAKKAAPKAATKPVKTAPAKAVKVVAKPAAKAAPKAAAKPAAKPVAWGPLQLEIQDNNLSHWSMKYTQLVLRKPPGGLLVHAGEVQRKFGGPAGMEVTALNNFYTGEYTGGVAVVGDARPLLASGEATLAPGTREGDELVSWIASRRPVQGGTARLYARTAVVRSGVVMRQGIQALPAGASLSS